MLYIFAAPKIFNAYTIYYYLFFIHLLIYIEWDVLCIINTFTCMAY